MANEGKVAQLKGKRGIAIDPAKASVPDLKRNEAGGCHIWRDRKSPHV